MRTLTPSLIHLVSSAFWRRMLVASVLVTLVAGSACANPVPAVAALTRANQTFAANLYRVLSRTDGNLFFSPYSISSVLSLAYAGARGPTAAEFAKVLDTPLPPAELASAYRQTASGLKAANAQGTLLTVANSVWVQQAAGLRPEFVALGRQQFQAAVRPVDFVNHPDAARDEINAWVTRATAGRIMDLIGPGALSPDSRMVLCNAVYFKGQWQKRFEAAETQQGIFYLAAHHIVFTQMMNEEGRLHLAQVDGLRVAELHYRGQAVSMVILLPDQLDGLAEIERGITGDRLGGWLDALAQGDDINVHLSLPRFTAGWSADVTPSLAEMGLKLALTPAADFSGISEHDRMFISKVVHKSYVQVDEEGTEAAAATAVVTFGISAGPRDWVNFRVDHPFIYLIRDNSTGTILFMGRVVDPR